MKKRILRIVLLFCTAVFLVLFCVGINCRDFVSDSSAAGSDTFLSEDGGFGEYQTVGILGWSLVGLGLLTVTAVIVQREHHWKRRKGIRGTRGWPFCAICRKNVMRRY